MVRQRHMSYRQLLCSALFGACVGALLMLQVHTTTHFYNQAPGHHLLYNTPAAANSASPQEMIMTKATTRKSITAQDIVERSFQETYALLVQECPSTNPLRHCLQQIYNHTLQDNVVPWWFQTLLRDSLDVRNGVFGKWHTMTAYNNINQTIQMCTMGKVGTTQWRKVFCLLQQPNSKTAFPCDREPKMLQSNHSTHKKVGRFVFVRDPLERFLSAFLDKCIGPNSGRQGHCEPSIVFQNIKTSVMQDISNNPKLFFQAYVDTIPLRWNMHFIPMGMFCNGLYRNLNSYVVGNMGPNFYQDVENVARTFHIMPQVNQVFNLTAKLKEKNALKLQNVGVETMAASHVLEYYTPKTVKRVLEYLSLDYMTLNLPIPTWAEQMIQQEEKEQ